MSRSAVGRTKIQLVRAYDETIASLGRTVFLFTDSYICIFCSGNTHPKLRAKLKKNESQHVGDMWRYQCALFLPTIRIGEDFLLRRHASKSESQVKKIESQVKKKREPIYRWHMALPMCSISSNNTYWRRFSFGYTKKKEERVKYSLFEL